MKEDNYISFVNHGNRVENSYNSLIIVLAADGGWPLGAIFTLVPWETQKCISFQPL